MISLLKRERRTHKKIVVSDESVIIGLFLTNLKLNQKVLVCLHEPIKVESKLVHN